MHSTDSASAQAVDIAKQIINNFKTRYLNHDGFVSRTYPASQRTLFDNFDDLAPFFIYFGEEEFLVEQVRRASRFSFDTLLAQNNLIYSYFTDEYLGGLYALWRRTRDKEVKDVLDQAIDQTTAYFMDDNDLFGTYDIRKKRKYRFRYYWSAGLLETFLEMGADYGYLQERVEVITKTWMDNPYFEKHGFFPFRWNVDLPCAAFYEFLANQGRIRRNQPQRLDNRGWVKKCLSNFKEPFAFHYLSSGLFTQIMKANSTFIFTLIELFRRTGNGEYKKVVVRWIKSVRQKMIKNDVVFGFYFPKGVVSDAALTHTFIFVDILMDTYVFVERDPAYIQLAKTIIDKRLKTRWSNGLIPISPEEDIDHMDQIVDFAISIRRVGELSKDTWYLKISKELIEKVLCLHQGEGGFYTHVSRDGQPVHLRANAIDPKYNGLLLKGLVNLLTLNQKMYESNELVDLFKDR